MPVALITGCSSGFGEAMALAFAEQGYQVVATMRRPEAAPARLLELAVQRPADIVLAPLDVTDARQRQEVVQLALSRFGRIDLLVNNAGVGARGAVEDTPDSQWRAMFDTNLFGPLELVRQVLPIMRAQRSGRIVNVTSVAAIMKTPFMAAYCASKHAFDTATAALNAEARSFGVRVVSVMPGPFKTALPAKSLDREPSAPYAETGARFNANFDALEAKAPEDLTPVVQAAIAAATDPDPRLRYLAGAEVVPILPPILEALAPLEKIALHLTGQG
ncbi:MULTISPECIES: SDR family oxidoreductase [unclassified Novosphingobium]|uniref:SDR family oxidoreductase n=1 Tax=Novosphingobium TaxID=165696 RepID=UPI001444CC69|nr:MULTISPECIES: SDR family oxidoreductase [unclassified Novosphingobium]NKJ42178.1 NAD(P)-dependent dehydrogenase (short-subunit alcohol dehydrogenase family) [Novosphingobium sp. SG720]NMN04564.1 NAD(P)-dependent dehydrogenase (short-subunit alcohol dehydrogenase family) [Novosphingobium sp. SG919]NMN85443.1 NAD(P)-dependent dehydrogenase (short-subunit alcohol dehydrogenase family) [Novosphingobium sp. SG916]